MDSFHPTNYTTGYQDHTHAWRRRVDVLRAEKQAKLMARLQRAPAIRAWNYMASKISPHTDLKRQITCLLTCWRRRCVGDYGYLEAIDIMEEKKEYWEALSQGESTKSSGHGCFFEFLFTERAQIVVVP